MKVATVKQLEEAIKLIEASRPILSDFIAHHHSTGTTESFAGSEARRNYDAAYADYEESDKMTDHLKTALSVAKANEYIKWIELGRVF